MACLNLQTICKDYYYDNIGGVLAGNINLNRVTVEAIETKWNVPQGDISTDSSFQVDVDHRSQGAAAAHSSVKVDKNKVGITIEYSLDQEYVKGLNQSLKVPLDEKLKLYGQSVDINLGKQTSVENYTIPLSVTANRPFGAGQTSETAHVSMSSSSHEAKFNCTCKLRGSVIFPENRGASEAGIVEILKEQRRIRDIFRREGSVVLFTVSGRCTFKLNNHETIKYQP